MSFRAEGRGSLSDLGPQSRNLGTDTVSRARFLDCAPFVPHSAPLGMTVKLRTSIGDPQRLSRKLWHLFTANQVIALAAKVGGCRHMMSRCHGGTEQ